MIKIIPSLFAGLLLLLCYQSSLLAQEPPVKKNYAYYSIEPEIVTNYLSNSARKLGFVRISIELMLEDADFLESVEHHSPLLRSAIIEVIGRQPADKVKSLTGREDIRLICLNKLKTLMKRETGSEVIKEVIFTKYLYQQS